MKCWPAWTSRHVARPCPCGLEGGLKAAACHAVEDGLHAGTVDASRRAGVRPGHAAAHPVAQVPAIRAVTACASVTCRFGNKSEAYRLISLTGCNHNKFQANASAASPVSIDKLTSA